MLSINVRVIILMSGTIIWRGIVMNHILEMLIKLLKVGMEAIDRKGLIAILTSSIGNDEMDNSEQAITVYNDIDPHRLNAFYQCKGHNSHEWNYNYYDV